MNRNDAVTAVKDALARVAPDADVASLPPDAPFREALEIDSLDFLSFVEVLSAHTGCRIEDEDYPALATLSGTADFLVAHAP